MLLHLGLNVITFRTLLHLVPNVITFRTSTTSPPPPPSPPFLTLYRIGTPYEVFQFVFFVFFRFAFFQVFTGNSDQTSIVKHSLRNHFKARYVRFYPVTYIHWSCLRVEIFGLK